MRLVTGVASSCELEVGFNQSTLCVATCMTRDIDCAWAGPWTWVGCLNKTSGKSRQAQAPTIVMFLVQQDTELV